MRALQVTGPRAIALREVPEPEMGPDDVLIAVKAVGICGTDVEIIDGHMAYYTSGAANYPITIGHEWVGTVEALGSDVSGLRLGDQVVGEVSIGCGVCETCRSGPYHRCPYRTETGVMNRNGGMADKLTLPSRAVHKVASHVSLASAALVEPTAIAYNGVRLADVSPSTTVAIIGDGPIGLLLLQVAQAFGATKTVMIGADSKRLALAGKIGAQASVDVRSDGWRQAVDDTFQGKAPDIVLEASGNPAGVDGVDVRHATERGIWVTNVPRYCTDEVAEHTLALILALQRQLRPAQRDLERGLWNQLSYRNIHKASETTLGIVGLGELGRATAAKALAVGFKVIGFDPALASGTTTNGVTIVPLNDLLEASDVVSLHLPLTDHTRHLMNTQRLSEMRRGAFLINVSRGGIVDEHALLNALRDGHLAGAALDAFETEPLPGSSPLHGADNLILTPHIAFLSKESLESLQTQAVEEVIRVMTGAHPLNAVNKVS